MADLEAKSLDVRMAVAGAAGAPADALATVPGATEPVVRQLPQGSQRAPFGAEPASLQVVLRGARR